MRRLFELYTSICKQQQSNWLMPNGLFSLTTLQLRSEYNQNMRDL